MYRLFFLFLGSLFVVSCSSSSTDPQDKSGLFGTVGALNSGAYDKKLAEKKRRLAALHAQNNQAQQRENALKLVERRKKMKLQQLQKEVDLSNRKNQQLKSNIRQLSQQLEVIDVEQQKQQNDIALLDYENHRNDQLNVQQRRKLNSLKRKRNRLRKQLELLLNKKD